MRTADANEPPYIYNIQIMGSFNFAWIFDTLFELSILSSVTLDYPNNTE